MKAEENPGKGKTEASANSGHRKYSQSHPQTRGPKEPKSHRQKESAIEGVPILDCPQGITNVESEWNYIALREGIVEYVKAEHGDIASIFRTRL